MERHVCLSVCLSLSLLQVVMALLSSSVTKGYASCPLRARNSSTCCKNLNITTDTSQQSYHHQVLSLVLPFISFYEYSELNKCVSVLHIISLFCKAALLYCRAIKKLWNVLFGLVLHFTNKIYMYYYHCNTFSVFKLDINYIWHIIIIIFIIRSFWSWLKVFCWNKSTCIACLPMYWLYQVGWLIKLESKKKSQNSFLDAYKALCWIFEFWFHPSQL